MRPKVSIIAALDENRGIGKKNQLLFRIPEDMKRFRKLTFNHLVIMGRVTFESIGRPLRHRTNIIVTHNKTYTAPGCLVVHSLKEAIRLAKKREKEEIFIIGGGQIYTQAMPYTNKLYLTIVKGGYDADTFFPNYSQFSKVVFKKEEQYKHYRYTFLDLETKC